MVSRYEEHEAARFSLIPWPEWGGLPHAERANLIAYHRICIYVDLHKAEVSARHSEKQAKAASRRGGRRGR